MTPRKPAAPPEKRLRHRKSGPCPACIEEMRRGMDAVRAEAPQPDSPRGDVSEHYDHCSSLTRPGKMGCDCPAQPDSPCELVCDVCHGEGEGCRCDCHERPIRPAQPDSQPAEPFVDLKGMWSEPDSQAPGDPLHECPRGVVFAPGVVPKLIRNARAEGWEQGWNAAKEAAAKAGGEEVWDAVDAESKAISKGGAPYTSAFRAAIFCERVEAAIRAVSTPEKPKEEK